MAAAIRKSKNRKAPGPDGIQVELLKLLGEKGMERLTALFNKIYQTGQIPREWLQSTFIPLPKKCKPSTCANFRLISLMSHSLKILLKVIQGRIYTRCEGIISNFQFGFRGGLGTRETLFCINVLLQKCREFQKSVYICYIHRLRKDLWPSATSTVDYASRDRADGRDVRLLKNLYWDQTTTICVDNELNNRVPIKRGVRQGSLLFNVYSEMIFNEALQGHAEVFELILVKSSITFDTRTIRLF